MGGVIFGSIESLSPAALLNRLWCASESDIQRMAALTVQRQPVIDWAPPAAALSPPPAQWLQAAAGSSPPAPAPWSPAVYGKSAPAVWSPARTARSSSVSPRRSVGPSCRSTRSASSCGRLASSSREFSAAAARSPSPPVRSPSASVPSASPHRSASPEGSASPRPLCRSPRSPPETPRSPSETPQSPSETPQSPPEAVPQPPLPQNTCFELDWLLTIVDQKIAIRRRGRIETPLRKLILLQEAGNAAIDMLTEARRQWSLMQETAMFQRAAGTGGWPLAPGALMPPRALRARRARFVVGEY